MSSEYQNPGLPLAVTADHYVVVRYIKHGFHGFRPKDYYLVVWLLCHCHHLPSGS